MPGTSGVKWHQASLELITIAKWISMGRLSRSSSKDFQIQIILNKARQDVSCCNLGGTLLSHQVKGSARREKMICSVFMLCLASWSGGETRHPNPAKWASTFLYVQYARDLLPLAMMYKWMDLEEEFGMLSSFMFHSLSTTPTLDVGCLPGQCWPSLAVLNPNTPSRITHLGFNHNP